MDHSDRHKSHGSMSGGSYGRFAAMIATSTMIMFGLMYLNTWAMDHVFFSQTRMWMALYMGGAMALIGAFANHQHLPPAERMSKLSKLGTIDLRIDYLHKMQRVYESEINRMQDMMDRFCAGQ